MMGIGISGVTGTGKSLLASTYAEQTDYQLVMLKTEALFLKPRMRFKNTSVVEEFKNILALLESSYMDAPSRFITNVTPLDIMAELYSVYSWHTLPTEEVDEMIHAAWAECCRISTKYLGIIMHIQPFECGARQEQLNALTVGLIHTRLVIDIETNMFTVRRSMVDNGDRLTALKHFVHNNMQESSFVTTSSLKH